jgi:hypothetical protein
MKTDTTDWIEKVRQMALELHAIQAAQEDTRKRERDAFSKLTTAQMFFERPPSYNEVKDELNRLAGESMRLEARMVKAALEGVKP